MDKLFYQKVMDIELTEAIYGQDFANVFELLRIKLLIVLGFEIFINPTKQIEGLKAYLKELEDLKTIFPKVTLDIKLESICQDTGPSYFEPDPPDKGERF